MNDFWSNVSRYPRFFISSLIGSMLIILTPAKVLIRGSRLRNLFSLIGVILITGLLIVTIANMTNI